ncbi:MAG: hypothetical protein SFT81_07375 [Candidatus Caenarcaniphilales bacterium]|nr:hypothetical protein [Candidatus Caenarcaniphilales bacterium]
MFRYRLERVLALREQELEKVKVEFQEATAAVKDCEKKIHLNQNQQKRLQTEMRESFTKISPRLYLNRINHLKEALEKLELTLLRLRENQAYIREKMIETQRKTEILKRHKDKQKQRYDDEERRKEEISLNELALTMRRIKNERDY